MATKLTRAVSPGRMMPADLERDDQPVGVVVGVEDDQRHVFPL
jgi:hypothetical protein